MTAMSISERIPGHFIDVSGYDKQQREALMDRVEDLAIMGEIGADIGDTPVAVYESPEGELIGAGWSSEYNGKIGFHLAVHPEHEGMGLGGEIANRMLSYTSKRLEEDPSLTFTVYVVNPEVMEMLFRRGMYVSLDCRDPDIPSDECVDMSMAPSHLAFFESAMRTSPEKYFDALQKGADTAGVPLENWAETMVNWGTTKSIPDGTADAIRETVMALPLHSLHQHYLWEQINVNGGESRTFPIEHPRPDPASELENEMIHIPDIEPELERSSLRMR